MVTIPVTIEFSVVGEGKVTSAFSSATAHTDKFNKSTKSAAAGAAGFRGKLDELAKSVRLIEGPLGGTAARLQTLVGIITRLNVVAATMVIAFAAIVAIVALMAPKFIAVRTEFDRIQNTLKSVTGSTSSARSEFENIIVVAQKYGLEIGATASQYAKLAAATRGTALAGAATRDIFQATAVASAALGLSSDQTAGILLAFQQMVSKGTVQAEELRGQLGERLPGAFRMAADAMGVTTQQLGKMLQGGKVLAEDLLPKLAQRMMEVYGPGAIEGANNLNSSINRLNTSWKLFLDALDRASGFTGKLKDYLTDIANLLDRIRRALPGSQIVDTGASVEIPPVPATTGGMPGIQDMGNVGANLRPYQNTKIVGDLKEINNQVKILTSTIGNNEYATPISLLDVVGIDNQIKKMEELTGVVKKYNLTKEEQYLYETHLRNLIEQPVVNKNGSISTLQEITKAYNGKIYLIPTIWGGKVYTTEEAYAHATEIGIEKFPSYNTEAEAKARYSQLHSQIDKDTIGVSKANNLFTSGVGGREASDYFRLQDEVNASLKKREDILSQINISADSLRLSMTDLLTPQEKYNAQMLVLEKTYGPGGISDNQELYTRGIKKLKDELYATDPILSKLSKGFDTFAEGVVSAMTTASSAMDGFKSVAKTVLTEILNAILQLTVFTPLKNAFLSAANSWATSSTGTQDSTALNAPVQTAQYGTSFDVPGIGGVDNKMVNLAMSPGEHVEVTPREQKNKSNGSPTWYVDMRGASDAAVAKLEQLVHSVNGSIEPRAVAAVYSASRTQPNLLNRRR